MIAFASVEVLAEVSVKKRREPEAPVDNP